MVNRMLVAAALLGLAATTQVSAQTCSTAPSCSVNNTASVTVPIVMQLTLSSTTTALTVPTAANYDAAPGVPDNGPTATIKANKGYTLKIAAQAATWTGTGGASATKAAGDLAWSTAVNGTFNGLTTGGATVVTTGAGGTASQPIFYQTSWHSATDTPGTYSLVVVYTLSVP